MIKASTVVTSQKIVREATLSMGGCKNPSDVAYRRKTAEMTVNIAHVESANLNTLSIQVGGMVEFVSAHSDIYQLMKKREVSVY